MKVRIVAYDQARNRVAERAFEMPEEDRSSVLDEVKARIWPIFTGKHSDWHSFDVTVTKD